MIHSIVNDKEFVDRLTGIILENLGDENFGVKELAQKSDINKVILNQRLQRINKKHVNQFIREIRLQKALELIRDEKYTVAEISYITGFSSPTYFNKCFHEHFGYPPGKIKKEERNGTQYVINETIEKKAINTKTKRKNSLFLVSAAVILLATGVFLTYRFYYRTDKTNILLSADGRISLVVMPFRNMTNDTVWNIWQEGIQTNLISWLSNYEELQVSQIETIHSIIQNKGITNYASLTPTLAGKISKNLEANVFVFGSIIKAGNTIRLNAQIINPATTESLKSFLIDGSADEILEMTDSLSVMIRNLLLISILEKTGPAVYHEKILKTAKSPEAYMYYIQGQNAYYKNDFPLAINWFSEALNADSNLVTAMSKIALAYYNEAQYEHGKQWCQRFYKHIDRLGIKEKLWANVTYALFFKTMNERIYYLRQLLDIDDQNPMVWFNIGDCYFEMEEFEKAIPEFEKALEIFKKWEIKPYWGAFYYELGICYHEIGQFQKEKQLYKKADKDFPDDPGLMDQHAWLQLALGDTVKANFYIEKWTSVRKEESWSDARIAGYMAYIHDRAHLPDKQEKFLRLAYSLEPENTSRINQLAYFLINTSRNISEGLQLTEKVLEIKPDNFNSQMIKGLGLFKLGKYPESFELLQKSWDLRMQKSIYNHKAFKYLEDARKAVATS
jgi:tetratricopeptide (TPR) repeat protein/AraC-like DNA-binding protein